MKVGNHQWGKFMNTGIKYPKTMHLPFSEGLQNDDRRLEDEYAFDGKTVAVTVKMDGENTSMYKDGIHARSLYAMSHPSQHYIKGFHGQIAHTIPDDWRICGENMYARHSIVYENLESFFYVFSIWDSFNISLNLTSTLDFCEERGLTHVKILDTLTIKGNDFSKVEELYHQAVADGEEGIVIRNVGSFPYNSFKYNVAKAVRKNHIQTEKHWTTTWVPNKLKSI